MDEKKKKGKQKQNDPPVATSEDIRLNAAIVIALAQQEPDQKKSEAQLKRLIDELDHKESRYKEMLESIQISKRNAIKAIGDKKINNSMIALQQAQ